LISNIFYYSIKLYAISSRTKSIKQGLYFPWFLKRVTTKTEFFVTSSSDILLIFRIKHKKKKHNFFHQVNSTVHFKGTVHSWSEQFGGELIHRALFTARSEQCPGELIHLDIRRGRVSQLRAASHKTAFLTGPMYIIIRVLLPNVLFTWFALKAAATA